MRTPCPDAALLHAAAPARPRAAALTRAAAARFAAARRAARFHACAAPARALATALLLAFVAASAPAQTTPAQRDAKQGSVAGRVTTSDGHPAAGLALALMPAEFTSDRRPAASGTTDGDGRYRLSNVPAGRYRLQLLAPAHTSPEMSGNSPFSSGRLISVGAGESIEDANLTVARGGVITGRVSTADGRPVIGARVQVLRPDRRGPEATVVNPFEFETDDRGVYRVYGLAAGRYLVAVGDDRESGIVMVGAAGPRYARTFHPAAPDAAQARPVEVTSGGETTGVDIAVADGPKSFQASGRIVEAETGRPVANMGFGHTALVGDGRDFGAFGMDGSRTNQNGEFTIKNLVPGRYAAFAANFGTATTGYSDPVRFEVTDGDVTGLVIRMHRGASIRGTAVIEGTSDRSVLAKLSTLSIFPNVTPAAGKTDDIQTPSFNSNRINADGTFHLTGIKPGRVTFTIWAFPQPKGFTLLRVERGGVEIPREGVEVGEGEQVAGLRLVIGYGTGVVRGQVTLAGGALPEGARLNVSARRVGAAGGDFPGGGEVDSRGRFSLEGLLAGEYELTVRALVRPVPGAQPPRFPTVRQIVSVAEGGEVNVSLVYDLSKSVEPNP